MIRSGEHYGRKIQLFGEVQLRLKAHSFYDIMRKGRKGVRCTPFGGQERRLFTHKDKCGKYISVIIERRKGLK